MNNHYTERLPRPQTRNYVDCYTVLAWWQQDCHRCVRHGLQLAGITLLWLVGLKIDWDCPVPHCIMGSRDQWEFPTVFQTPVRVPTACRLGCAKGLWKSLGTTALWGHPGFEMFMHKMFCMTGRKITGDPVMPYGSIVLGQPGFCLLLLSMTASWLEMFLCKMFGKMSHFSLLMPYGSIGAWCQIQCGAVVTPKSSQKTPHTLPVRVRYRVSFVSSVPIAAMLFAL